MEKETKLNKFIYIKINGKHFQLNYRLTKFKERIKFNMRLKAYFFPT